MSTLVGVIEQIVQEQLRSMGVAELGVVERNGLHPHAQGSDKDNYACDVRLKNSGLVLEQVPVATGHIGTAAIPNEGDLVLLAFSGGDPNQPIIIGRLYNDADRPPLNNANEVIFRLPLARPDDQTVKVEARNLGDRNPRREILVEMQPKIHVHFQDHEIVAEAGQSRLSLQQPGMHDGKVVVEAGRSTITMNQDGDITIEAGGDITLKTATGDISIEGMNVNVKSTLATKIEAGTSAQVKANLDASLEGALSATLKGATASIKGITSFSPG